MDVVQSELAYTPPEYICTATVIQKLSNVFHCDIAEIRSVGKTVIIQTFS